MRDEAETLIKNMIPYENFQGISQKYEFFFLLNIKINIKINKIIIFKI